MNAEPAAAPVRTPEPPYLAVIFTSRLAPQTGSGPEPDGYREAAERMAELVAGQPGFLGMESARGPDGLGITVSYWRDETAITGWRRHVEHLLVQDRGRREWYNRYVVRVAQVHRAYGSEDLGDTRAAS